MQKNQLKIGQTVSFGRPNGEKTLGIIIRLNISSATIESIEDRGITSVKRSGLKYRVAYEFIYPANQMSIPRDAKKARASSPSRSYFPESSQHPLYSKYLKYMKTAAPVHQIPFDIWLEDAEDIEEPVEQRASKKGEYNSVYYDRVALQQQVMNGEDMENEEMPPPREGYWTPQENIAWFERYVISGRDSYKGSVKELTCKQFASDLVQYGKMEKHAKNIFFKRIDGYKTLVAIIFDYTGDDDLVATESVAVFYHKDAPSKHDDTPAAEFIMGKTMEGDTIPFMSGNIKSEAFYKILTKAIQEGLDTIRRLNS